MQRGVCVIMLNRKVSKGIILAAGDGDYALAGGVDTYLDLMLLGTLPAYHGRGLGRTMLSFVYDIAESQGWPRTVDSYVFHSSFQT